MASGPDNYNHNKLSKPIFPHHRPTRAQWYLAKAVDLPNYDRKGINIVPAKKNCTPQCRLCAVEVEDVLTFVRPSTSEIKKNGKPDEWSVFAPSWRPDPFLKMADPNFDIQKATNLVYLSGVGGACASMMWWNDEWWIVFGIKHKYQKDENGLKKCVSTRHILHSVQKLGWDQSGVDQIKKDLIIAFGNHGVS